MTGYYIPFAGEGVCWRLRRQQTPSPKHKTLIVILSEAKNLSQSFISKVYRTTILIIKL